MTALVSAASGVTDGIFYCQPSPGWMLYILVVTVTKFEACRDGPKIA